MQVEMPLTRFGKWTILYGVVVTEVAAMAASYHVWDKLNRSQDYRRWMLEHHPKVLDVFYMSCTLVGVSDAKERDWKDWENSNINR